MNTQTDRTISSFFEYATRSDGTRYVRLGLIDDGMAWLTDAVHAAHDGEMPNDWRYETCWRIVDALGDYDLADLDDYRAEIADSLVDVYTHDLIKWLGDDISRTGYCDEAIGEGLDIDDLVGIIRAGQSYAISQMVDVLADAIAENGGQS